MDTEIGNRLEMINQFVKVIFMFELNWKQHLPAKSG